MSFACQFMCSVAPGLGRLGLLLMSRTLRKSLRLPNQGLSELALAYMEPFRAHCERLLVMKTSAKLVGRARPGTELKLRQAVRMSLRV